MRITAFNGSHYKGKSNTEVMVDEFLAGASEAGAKTESILLVDYNIRHCTHCMDCFATGECSTQDDMPALIKKFADSDIAIFASPLYMDMVSSVLKAFIDRLLPLLDPHFEKDEHGEFRHSKRRAKYPDFIVMSNGHMPEQSQFQAVQLYMSRLARTMHTRIIAEVYRSTGGLLSSEEEAFKPAAHQYKELLREAGREIVLQGRISESTANNLAKELVPTGEYIAYANKMWDKLLHAGVK
jgi:multimeric flavodoxin WrbA